MYTVITGISYCNIVLVMILYIKCLMWLDIVLIMFNNVETEYLNFW